MRFGIASWAFPEIDLNEKVNLFADLGFDAISFFGLWELEEAEWPVCQSVGRALERRKMIATVHTKFASPGAKDTTLAPPEHFRRRMKRLTDWHAEFGGLATIMFDPLAKPEDADQHLMAEMAADLRTTLEITEGTEIKVGVEDIPLDGGQLAALNGLADESDRLGLLIDLGHLNMRIHNMAEFDETGSSDLIHRFFQELPLKVWELHVHNNDGTADQHAPLTEGNADFESMAAALREIGFDGVSTLEFGPGDMPVEEALKIEERDLRHWRALMEEH